MPAPLQLYWCWTYDGSEDWFVVARNPKQASAFFSEYEGIEHRDEVIAQHVKRLPEQHQGVAKIGWPSDEVLEACDGVFLHKQTPRVVRIGRRSYVEGFMDFLVSQGDLNPPKP